MENWAKGGHHHPEVKVSSKYHGSSRLHFKFMPSSLLAFRHFSLLTFSLTS